MFPWRIDEAPWTTGSRKKKEQKEEEEEKHKEEEEKLTSTQEESTTNKQGMMIQSPRPHRVVVGLVVPSSRASLSRLRRT
jgi:hypothetical protein